MNDFDNDDLITLQLKSKTIEVPYSQLVKYSKLIRDKYIFSDAISFLSQEIHKFLDEYQYLSENIFLFITLLKQNFISKSNPKLTYKQCIDLLKISEYFEVRKLSHLINEYIKDHNIDIDFIIQMIQYESITQNKEFNSELKISNEIETLLSDRIDECLSNDKFIELPISIIYRIIELSSHKSITSDKIFKFIKKSINKLAVLFSFIDLEELSDDQLEELYDIYSKSDETQKQ